MAHVKGCFMAGFTCQNLKTHKVALSGGGISERGAWSQERSGSVVGAHWCWRALREVVVPWRMGISERSLNLPGAKAAWSI